MSLATEGKTEIIESPKVAIAKNLTLEDVWQTFVSRFDRDVLMTKYHNLAKKINGERVKLQIKN